MAIQADIIGPIKDAFTKANEVFVLLPQNAGQEMIAAGAGLAAVLKGAQKQVTFACPTPISNTAKSIPGAAVITNSIGNRNLIISIKVDNRDSIDKVSYNLNEDEKTFNLVVQPKSGELPLKKDAVSFTYSGSQADLVIIVGGNRFEDLGSFYETERQLFSTSKTIAISRFTTTPFADFHITDSQTTGLSELSLELCLSWGLTFSVESATAFLVGIDAATQNLQSPNVTADTFEKVAPLMRSGGVRQPMRPVSGTQSTTHPQPGAAINLQDNNSQVISSTPVNQAVPQEWLAPKIYKSSNTPATTQV